MRFEKTTRKLKCKKCGQSKPSNKDTLKGVNHCDDCFELYIEARVNCSVCGKSFKRKDEYYSDKRDKKWNKKNFCCEECYDEFINEMDEKDKMDKWLKEYFKVETLPSRIYVQMEDFKSKKKISYKWCYATLRYVVSVKDTALKDGTIGIVPYMYDECRDYVTNYNKAKKLAKESDKYKARFSDEIITIKEIDINKDRDKVINKKIITEQDLKGVLMW